MHDPETSKLLPDLAGARLLVVGCGTVGRTTAQLAAGLGVKVIGADRSAEQLDNLRAEIPHVEIHTVNARDNASAARMLDAAQPDHILLSTGWPLFVEAGSFDLAASTDFVADRLEPILAIANWIARRGHPTRSLTIVSGWCPPPQRGWALWSFVAPAIVGLAENLTVELAPTRINVVGPGPMVDTPMALAAAGGTEAGRSALIAAIEATIPTGRAVRVLDTARQIILIAGDPIAAGSYRQVDGGARLTSGAKLDALKSVPET